MIASIIIRSVLDPTSVFEEQDFATEAQARAQFERMRERAETAGGSAVLVVDGVRVASFSHCVESE